jgi:hypothetical protein
VLPLNCISLVEIRGEVTLKEKPIKKVDHQLLARGRQGTHLACDHCEVKRVSPGHDFQLE